eukprot:gene21470-28443_t
MGMLSWLQVKLVILLVQLAVVVRPANLQGGWMFLSNNDADKSGHCAKGVTDPSTKCGGLFYRAMDEGLTLATMRNPSLSGILVIGINGGAGGAAYDSFYIWRALTSSPSEPVTIITSTAASIAPTDNWHGMFKTDVTKNRDWFGMFPLTVKNSNCAVGKEFGLNQDCQVETLYGYNLQLYSGSCWSGSTKISTEPRCWRSQVSHSAGGENILTHPDLACFGSGFCPTALAGLALPRSQVLKQGGGWIYVTNDDADNIDHCGVGMPDPVNACSGLYRDLLYDAITVSTGYNASRTGILVIGMNDIGYPNFHYANINFTAWWGATGLTEPIIYISTVADILTVDFSTYKMLYIPSTYKQCYDGIIPPQNDALVQRKWDIQAYVNVHLGALFVNSMDGFASPYDFFPGQLTYIQVTVS